MSSSNDREAIAAVPMPRLGPVQETPRDMMSVRWCGSANRRLPKIWDGTTYFQVQSLEVNKKDTNKGFVLRLVKRANFN